jgi:hypothetical protein
MNIQHELVGLCYLFLNLFYTSQKAQEHIKISAFSFENWTSLFTFVLLFFY